MVFAPTARHLLRARDLADARYSEPLGVEDLAGAAGLSRAHFSRQFRRAFGASPHADLLTRRLERAAAMLRTTDRSVIDICLSVGLQSVGSFTTSFTRAHGMSPAAYRTTFLPAAHQPGVRPELRPARLRPTSTPPVMDSETAEQVRALMAKGFAGTIFLTTDDCQASHEELKQRGVEFVEEPEERPCGIDAAFRDPSGNHIRLTQLKEIANV